MKMKNRLIIDGNSVYEIDEECMQKKNEEEKKKNNKSRNNKGKRTR